MSALLLTATVDELWQAEVLAGAQQQGATVYGWEQFMAGYQAAIKGVDLAAMKSDDEIAGWWYATTPATADDTTPDANWIRYGC